MKNIKVECLENKRYFLFNGEFLKTYKDKDYVKIQLSCTMQLSSSFLQLVIAHICKNHFHKIYKGSMQINSMI